jgi:hypothetical protein
MANGDAAAAAGLATFAPTQDIRLGYDNDNIRGDELAAHLTNGTHPASAIVSGVFDAARIPNIDASKITSGTLPIANGGTGATTAGNALTNIGAASNRTTSNNVGIGWTQGGGFRGYVDATDFGRFAFLDGSGNITNPVNTGGNVNAAGFSTGGGITAAGTYNQTNTGRALFVASNGLFGVGSSSRKFKKQITDAVLDIKQVLQIRVRNFVYKNSISEDETVHIGVIAEELQELGLEEFLFFNEDGTPDGVAYEKLALALIPVIQNQEERLQALESKVK